MEEEFTNEEWEEAKANMDTWLKPTTDQVPYIGDRYTEDRKPRYVVRDESYVALSGESRPRFLVERMVPSGRQGWGVTTYLDRAAAETAASVLNVLVLNEVP